MRPLKMLKPIDIAIRGVFLAVVVIGGVVGQLRSQATPTESMSGAENVAEFGMGLPLPAARSCQPTAADTAQPRADTQPGARQEYVLSGSVKSSTGCTPIGGARIEFWPSGAGATKQDEAGVAFADASGAYRFNCNDTATASGRPGPIHLRVSADGYTALVTDYDPKGSPAEGEFDVVLQPGK